jgi:hypothetical protein
MSRYLLSVSTELSKKNNPLHEGAESQQWEKVEKNLLIFPQHFYNVGKIPPGLATVLPLHQDVAKLTTANRYMLDTRCTSSKHGQN